MDKVQGPSPEPWNDNYCTPKKMTEADIWEVIEAFGAAAARAVKAGVDVVAVHGAHGYLIHSFASPAVSKPLILSLIHLPLCDITDTFCQSQITGRTSGEAVSRTASGSELRSSERSAATFLPRPCCSGRSRPSTGFRPERAGNWRIRSGMHLSFATRGSISWMSPAVAQTATRKSRSLRAIRFGSQRRSRKPRRDSLSVRWDGFETARWWKM